jgi:hypothetical protein
VHLHLLQPAQSRAAPRPGSGNERAIVDLDCRHHGYVVCDVTKDDFQVAAMRVTPNAFVGSIAEAKAEVGMRYRVSAGDLEPRKV